MSLKSLLAVGESFSGTGIKPYEVKKQRQIPIFGAAAEPAPDKPVEGAPAAPDELNFEKEREARIHITPERRRIEQDPPERRRFLDRRWRGGPAKKLTQAEMSLEQVRVVRNDLSDSDLELAPRRAARSAESDLNPFAPRPIAAIGRPTHEKLGMGDRVARWFRFLKKPRG